ncbi:MAG: DNA polymerase III subunit beta [Anaerovoracaceae bacterium]|jgi:DNA polymerase-3 subunit beta
MKFSCEQQILTRALNVVSRAVSVKTTLPVLKGILLTAENGKLRLSGSNLDFSIEKTVDAVVEEPGSIIVSAKLFGEIVGKLPRETVNVEVLNTSEVRIYTLNSEFRIIGQSPDEFPSVGEVKNVRTQLSFDKNMFAEMIRQTYFCASIDESRGIIVGELLELEDGVLTMVTIDGFRIAIAREHLTHEKNESFVIPAKYLYEISKIIQESENDEDIIVTLTEKKAVILLEKTKIVVTLLAGQFVNYKNALPTECTTEIVVDRKILLDSVERASLVSRDVKTRMIKISVEKNLMTITSGSEEGKVKEEIIVNNSGDDITIGFNSNYIMDALKAIRDDTIKIQFTEPVKPCVIRPLEGDSYEYIVLPVRLTSAD